MIEQGTPEWHEQRRGKVTASRFKDVLTKARGGYGFGKTALSYIAELQAERETMLPTIVRPNEAMRWGHDHEDEAIAVYSEITQRHVERVGFVERPELPGVGCSPDGIILSDNRGVEVKCPFSSRVHWGSLVAGVCPVEHLAQVQGCMWVTGCDEWDFCSYDKRFQDFGKRLFRVRVERDEKYIDNLAFRVASFLEMMDAELETLNERLKT